MDNARQAQLAAAVLRNIHAYLPLTCRQITSSARHVNHRLTDPQISSKVWQLLEIIYNIYSRLHKSSF